MPTMLTIRGSHVRPETYLLRVWSQDTTRGNVPKLKNNKNCEIFAKRMSYLLAHVTTKKVEDKSEEKRLEDVPIVRDFPDVFPECWDS
ncbi:hypothetical protein Tco_0782846 [Tanacetum coccineum]